MAPYSSTLAWKIPWARGAWWAVVHGVVKSRTRLSDFPITFHFHALEKEMATHCSVLAWRIPGTGEPGGLPSMGSHRVRHDWSDLAAAAAATLWIGRSFLKYICRIYRRVYLQNLQEDISPSLCTLCQEAGIQTCLGSSEGTVIDKEWVRSSISETEKTLCGC